MQNVTPKWVFLAGKLIKFNENWIVIDWNTSTLYKSWLKSHEINRFWPKNARFSVKKYDAIFGVGKSHVDAIFDGILLNKKLVIQKMTQFSR